MNIRILSLFLAGIALVGIALAGCSTFSVSERQNEAYQIATQAGFQPFTMQAGMFRLAGFYKFSKTQKVPTLYIEGDGFAWIDRYTVSPNPTPRNPFALKLAVLDTSQSVFYIARPCQYVNLDQEPNCDQKYWTDYRFSKEVLQSYNDVLDNLKKQLGVQAFHLVGFSGGGAIAALLAAQRTDIRSLRTISGNLDQVSLNAARGVSPLVGSLNPIDYVSRLRGIPQIIYTGAEDKTVPSWVARSFVRAEDNSTCVRLVSVPGARHAQGWLSYWRNANSILPRCQ